MVDFPTAEVLGPEASDSEIKALIVRCHEIFVKPNFRGGVGKKGKAGLVGRAKDLKTALKEKERLSSSSIAMGMSWRKPQGVTFEGAVPAEHEVYVCIADSTRYRAPTITITHRGGVEIEDLPKDQIAEIPFDPLTGPEVVRDHQCFDRHQGAEGDHLALGAEPAEAVGPLPL